MRGLFFTILFAAAFVQASNAQNKVATKIFTPNDLFSAIKYFHPVTKQAAILPMMAQKNLQATRGFFDPTVFMQFDRKTFDGKDYWSQLYAELQIPTYSPFEIKIGYEKNTGLTNADGTFTHQSAERVVLPSGLLAVGLKASLLQGLLTDERRTALQQSKVFLQQSYYEQQQILNDLYYNAYQGYCEWWKAWKAMDIYTGAYNLAKQRLDFVKKAVAQGEHPAIDTLEILSQVQLFSILKNEALIEFRKNKYLLSSYLWLNEVTPLELDDNTIPLDFESVVFAKKIEADSIAKMVKNLSATHPKILQINAEIRNLALEKRLYQNKLLPKVDVQYQYLVGNLGNNPSLIDRSPAANNKVSVSVAIPLFLRNERGNYGISQLKVNSYSYEKEKLIWEIENKVNASFVTFNIMGEQVGQVTALVNSYSILLQVEQQRYNMGESSVFVINNREQKLIDGRLKEIELKTKFLLAEAGIAWNAGTFLF